MKENMTMLKLADMVIRPKDGTGDFTSRGIFIGSESMHKEKSKELMETLKKTKSLSKTKAAWKKKYPKDYVTLAFKKTKAPKKRMFFDRGYKNREAFHKERTARPRTFLRVGRAGGFHQKAFYSEVARGLYDKELTKNAPNISRADKKMLSNYYKRNFKSKKWDKMVFA